MNFALPAMEIEASDIDKNDRKMHDSLIPRKIVFHNKSIQRNDDKQLKETEVIQDKIPDAVLGLKKVKISKSELIGIQNGNDIDKMESIESPKLNESSMDDSAYSYASDSSHLDTCKEDQNASFVTNADIIESKSDTEPNETDEESVKMPLELDQTVPGQETEETPTECEECVPDSIFSLYNHFDSVLMEPDVILSLPDNQKEDTIILQSNNMDQYQSLEIQSEKDSLHQDQDQKERLESEDSIEKDESETEINPPIPQPTILEYSCNASLYDLI